MHRRIALVAVVALLAGLATTVPAGAAPPAAGPLAGTVTLPTGEQVLVQGSGASLRVVEPAGQPRVQVQRIGGEVYAIPTAYQLLVGSVVDRSLFDLTRLHGAAADAVPVSLTLPSATATVPGVRIAAHSGKAARGFVTDPAAFGRYLRGLAQRSDVDALPQIALAAGQTPPVSSAAGGRLVTVTVDAIDPPGGKLRTEGVLIVNMDDSMKYIGEVGVKNGPKQVQLPVGHYALSAESLQLYGTGPDQRAVFHTAFVTDLNVTADGQQLTVDLRLAKTTVYDTFAGTESLRTDLNVTNVQLTDAKGQPAIVFTYLPDSGVQSLMAPSNGARVGRLSSSSLGQFTSTDGRSAYFYSAGHPNAIVPDEQVRIAPSSVSTVPTRYYAGPGTDPSGQMGRTPVYSYLDPGVVFGDEVAMPSARTEYLAGAAGVVWHGFFAQYYGQDGFAGMWDVRSFPTGSTTREDFWRGPIAAGVRTQPTTLPNVCSLCRTDTSLVVGLAPTTDSDAAHGGALVGPPGGAPDETRMRIYRDGTQVFDGVNTSDFPYVVAQVDVPAGSANYRIVETVNRAVDGVPLSTHSTSVWGFSSAAGSGGQIPSAWTCGAAGSGPCVVPDLLSVRVPLPTSLTGVLPAGDSSFVVTVGRAQNATPSAITGFTFATSTDGSTFTPQRVIALSGGRYVVTIHNTAAAGTPVTVRWTAQDAAGSTLTQTVQAAYLAG